MFAMKFDYYLKLCVFFKKAFSRQIAIRSYFFYMR